MKGVFLTGVIDYACVFFISSSISFSGTADSARIVILSFVISANPPFTKYFSCLVSWVWIFTIPCFSPVITGA